MEILCAFLLLCVIAMAITCIYVSNKSQKENEELRKELNELKSKIDSYGNDR